jgi:rare lipoprotein A
MKSFLKATLVAGFMAASLAAMTGEAKAEPLVSSYYGYELAGSLTASGVPFDPAGYTAASLTYPLGTQLLVSYGGNSVVVTVNDRGPYVGGRQIDLSQGAAEAIGLTSAGVDVVDVQVIG